MADAAGEREMTESEYARKLDELDRLLNDPDVPMEPAQGLVSAGRDRAARHGAATRTARPEGSGPYGGDQELAVAFRAGDRAFGDAQHAPARQRSPPGMDALAHRRVNRGVAHHALAADGVRPSLELRLDQRHCPGARRA